MKVLLADDNSRVRDFIKMVLRTPANRYVFTECTNGAEAVRLFRQEQPDIILLDIMMDEMDGLTALRQIRAVNPSQRVVIISQLSEAEYGPPALAAGAAAYLNKEQLLRLPQLLEQLFHPAE